MQKPKFRKRAIIPDENSERSPESNTMATMKLVKVLKLQLVQVLGLNNMHLLDNSMILIWQRASPMPYAPRNLKPGRVTPNLNDDK